MPGRRVISDLEISWEDSPRQIGTPVHNPWAGVESLAQILAGWMCASASALAAAHAIVFFCGV